jgi:hypothetical protein
MCVTVWSPSYLTCSGTSPLVRRCCLFCTSAVYSYLRIHTVCSYTQYNLSSILQFFLYMRVFHTATLSAHRNTPIGTSRFSRPESVSPPSREDIQNPRTGAFLRLQNSSAAMMCDMKSCVFPTP